MERTITVNWSILINFFNDIIKNNAGKFNTSTFTYPEEISFRHFNTNYNKTLRFRIIVDYLEFQLGYKLDALQSLNNNFKLTGKSNFISRAIRELDNKNKSRTIKIKVPIKSIVPIKRRKNSSLNTNTPSSVESGEWQIATGKKSPKVLKRKSRSNLDVDYEPDSYSQEDKGSSARLCNRKESECKNTKTELEKALRRIQELELELDNLKKTCTASELTKVTQSKGMGKGRKPCVPDFWVIISLFSTSLGMSVRDIPSLFQFLKSNVKCLNNIYVPKKDFIHQCRYSIRQSLENPRKP